MRLLRSLAIVAVLTTASAQGSNAETPEGAAEAAARVWLGLVDAGDYAKSWVTGAEYFRNLVLQAQWVTSVARGRGSLGPEVAPPGLGEVHALPAWCAGRGVLCESVLH